jgi:hypothetical protein
VFAGRPTIEKPFAAGGSPATSIASQFFSRYLPDARLPFRMWAPTWQRPFSSTLEFGRFVGRWTPVVGWGLLTYDAYRIGSCVAERP